VTALLSCGKLSPKNGGLNAANYKNIDIVTNIIKIVINMIMMLSVI